MLSALILGLLATAAVWAVSSPDGIAGAGSAEEAATAGAAGPQAPVPDQGAAAGVPSGDATSEARREGTSGPQDHQVEDTSAAANDSPARELTPEQMAKEKLLRDRVQERWNAVIKRDFASAYAFETPEYRKAHTAEQYAGGFGPMIRWHMATVKEVRYDRANESEVVVTLDYSFPLGSGDNAVRASGDYKERWVLVEDQWWRQNVPQPLGAATPSKSSPQE